MAGRLPLFRMSLFQNSAQNSFIPEDSVLLERHAMEFDVLLPTSSPTRFLFPGLLNPEDDSKTVF
jgi:hypothetical protein